MVYASNTTRPTSSKERPPSGEAPHRRGFEFLVACAAAVAFAVANALRLGALTFSTVEVAAFVTGAGSVWLCARSDVRTWPVGILNSVLFVLLFWDARLFADAAVNCWYVVVGVYGWWYWTRGGGQRPVRPVSTIS